MRCLGWVARVAVALGFSLFGLVFVWVGWFLACSRLRSCQGTIVCGPFLALGSTIAVFAGEAIIRWWRG